VNFWEDLTTILIAFGLALLFFAGEKISIAMEWKLSEIICHTLRVLAKWNAVIMFLAINLDDIILFSAVELKSLNLGSGGSHSNTFSFAMAIVFISSILVLSTFIYLYARRLRARRIIDARNNHLLRTRPRGIVAVDEGFQVIFRGFRDNSIVNQLFFMIYMFRIGIPMLVAVCLEFTPIGITILQVLISLAILTFLLKKKPFIKKINHQQIVLFETIVLIMNFCMLILTVLSMVGLHNTKGANILGDIVIIGNDIINLMCLVFLILKLYIEIKILKAFTKKNNVTKTEATGLYLQLLFIPLQLGNMGFEEMIAYDIPSHEAKVKPVKFLKGLPQKQKPNREAKEDKSNISFDFMENSVQGSDTLRQDRRSLLQDSLRNNLHLLSPGSESKRLETFGSTFIASPDVTSITKFKYDLESPNLSPQIQASSITFQNEALNESPLFLNVNFDRTHRNRRNNTLKDQEVPLSSDRVIDHSIHYYDTAQLVNSQVIDNNSDPSLSLIQKVSNDVNPTILRKLNRKTITLHDDSGELQSPPKSLRKSTFSPGSLLQHDLEEFLRDIRKDSPRRISRRSGLEINLDDNNNSLGGRNSTLNGGNSTRRGRSYDYDYDVDGDRGHSQEDEDRGVTKLRKQFVFRDISADIERKKKKEPISKVRLDKNLEMRLWRRGKAHFKPNYKP